MGKKKEEEKVAANAAKEPEDEEDSPIVKTLKELDDRYCKLENEYDAEVDAIRKKYLALQNPILEERAKALADASTSKEEDKSTGTPACKGFWLQALNASELSQAIEPHDEPVLEYLKDIKFSDLSENPRSGSKLEFVFAENPYFTNETLWVEIRSDYDAESHKPYKELSCIEVKSGGVDWKAGKDVTVELATKKVKGGGAKKAKQKAKAKEEPRSSFFRFLFRNLKQGDPAPTDLGMDMGDMDDVDDDEVVDDLLEQLDGFSDMIKEVVVPYAIRLYTGELAADDDDDEDDESESDCEVDEEVDDDDDDDDDDEDEGPKGKAKRKPKASAKQGAGKGAGKSQEECKQQ